MSYFYIGLDLGQATDYTAITVVERLDTKPTEYHLRHVERPQLGTPYPAIVARVSELAASAQIAGNYMIVVDATGVGVAVVDLLRAAKLCLVPVTITAGDTVAHQAGFYRVPKRDLVFGLLAVLQTGRLKVAEGLALGPTLVNELLHFKVKIDPATAHDSYAVWREGVHDDLVLSAALAIWYADRVGFDCVAFVS